VLFVQAGALFAAPFDLERLEVTGPPAPVVENVMASPNAGSAQFAVGSGGLVFARGAARGVSARLEWLDLAGNISPLFTTDENYQSLSLSPDGTRLAIETTERKESSEIWIHDLARQTRSRLTVNQVADSRPVWTPDGTRIVFASAIDGTPNLYWQLADGSAPAERLTSSQGAQFPGSWHPDGKRLAFTEGMTRFSLKLLTLPERTVRSIADGPGSEGHPRISPDGRWLAYTSDESGQFEVYVRPFPDGAGRWPVSSTGGAWPLWSPIGNSLYYATLTGELMSVTFEAAGGIFKPGRSIPVPNGSLFTRSTGYPWDIHPDGKRFAAGVREVRALGTTRDDLVLILGFLDDLKARVK
jgi:serine/threonine-protein kinase